MGELLRALPGFGAETQEARFSAGRYEAEDLALEKRTRGYGGLRPHQARSAPVGAPRRARTAPQSLRRCLTRASLRRGAQSWRGRGTADRARRLAASGSGLAPQEKECTRESNPVERGGSSLPFRAFLSQIAMEATARPTLAERLYAAFDAIRGKDQPEPAKPPLEKVATIPVAAAQPSQAMSPQALLAGNLDAAQGLRGVSKGDHVPVNDAGAQFARQATPRPTFAQELAAGRGTSPSKAPEPAREHEHEKG
jgi:hypothetical protein